MDKRQPRRRILLVDDESDVRASTRMLLELDDYEVIEAETGSRALALFEKQPFDLVITDFRMGRMNGGELAAKIKALVPAMPVIMITGFHDEVPAGVVDVILDKPFSVEQLRKEILGRIGKS